MTETAEKQLSRLPKERVAQIIKAIQQLGDDPFAGDIQRLKNKPGRSYYRRRVGRYRIIFLADHMTKTAIITAIAVRSEKTYR